VPPDSWLAVTYGAAAISAGCFVGLCAGCCSSMPIDFGGLAGWVAVRIRPVRSRWLSSEGCKAWCLILLPMPPVQAVLLHTSGLLGSQSPHPSGS